MNIGNIRHASDIKADDMTLQSQGMLHPQTGMFFIHVYWIVKVFTNLFQFEKFEIF